MYTLLPLKSTWKEGTLPGKRRRKKKNRALTDVGAMLFDQQQTRNNTKRNDNMNKPWSSAGDNLLCFKTGHGHGHGCTKRRGHCLKTEYRRVGGISAYQLLCICYRFNDLTPFWVWKQLQTKYWSWIFLQSL